MLSYKYKIGWDLCALNILRIYVFINYPVNQTHSIAGTAEISGGTILLLAVSKSFLTERKSKKFLQEDTVHVLSDIIII